MIDYNFQCFKNAIEEVFQVRRNLITLSAAAQKASRFPPLRFGQSWGYLAGFEGWTLVATPPFKSAS